MFKQLKELWQANFKLLTAGQTTLYRTSVSGSDLVETFLQAFPEDLRQGYNCNCCKSFIKHYGNVVVISGNKVVSIWDMVAPGYYQGVADALNALVTSAPIRDVFVTKEAKLGTDVSRTTVDGEVVRWDHFYLVLPRELVNNSMESEESVMGVRRDATKVFKRALDELTIDATETVLELVAQNSLYKGEENQATLSAFLREQKAYAQLPDDQKEVYAWKQANSGLSGAVTSIRGTSIGSLLIDLSEGMELDQAVAKFERMVAPENYKRPQAIFTKKMVEEAEKTLQKLGLAGALGRRFAHVDDVGVNNVLFVNTSRHSPVTQGTLGVLESMKAEAAVNPRSFDKLETISLMDFLEKVLPFNTQVEILLENQHEPKLVSLIAPADPDAPSLFKWNNPFSWSYNNGVADAMKERVKAAGGNVEGVLRYSIQWNEDGKSICDLDAHAYEPGGVHIGFSEPYRKDRGNIRTAYSGQLDVDMIDPAGVGVENIVWTDQSKMRPGVYKFVIHNYNGKRNSGFQAQVEVAGETYNFSSNVHLSGTVTVAEVHYDGRTFTVKPHLTFTSGVVSKELWGMKTQTFQNVNRIMYSPNYWDGQGVGNRHVFFMLDGAENTGVVRGFLNEFLRPDLEIHRKVFEALGGKLAVAPSENQLSGLGFSTTSRSEFIVRVNGKFQRTLKVTI